MSRREKKRKLTGLESVSENSLRQMACVPADRLLIPELLALVEDELTFRSTGERWSDFAEECMDTEDSRDLADWLNDPSVPKAVKRATKREVMRRLRKGEV
jgi:hypothetical protein